MQRLTYRRHCRYNTRGNRVKVIKTPGGKLVYHNVSKIAKIPKCGDCKLPLRGVARLRPNKAHKVSPLKRRVARAYGGSRCGQCVRSRILRAFLIEEQKCVKLVLAEKEAAERAADKAEKEKKDEPKKKSKKADK